MNENNQPQSQQTASESAPKIKSITFASTQGGYSYFLGQGQPKQELTKISLETRHIQGDPYDFYVGRTADGQIVFEANRMNASIVIEYQTVEP